MGSSGVDRSSILPFQGSDPGSKSNDENPGWSTKIYLTIIEFFDEGRIE